MRIALIARDTLVEPLGLMYLGSLAKDLGCEVDYYTTLNDGKPSVDSRYDWVGLSVYTGYHKQMFSIGDLLGKDRIIIGGPHATFFSRDCSSHAKHVIVGEGFPGLKKVLIGEAREDILLDRNLVKISDIPIPDRSGFYSQHRQYRESAIKSVISSFGCPYACTYCFNDSYRKLYPKFRIRQLPVDRVVSECAEVKKYSTKMIYFQDDCFGVDLNWLKIFADHYSSSIGIPFHCQMRPEMVTETRLKCLKEAGCSGITLALETFSEEVRSTVLNRSTSNAQIYKACELIKKFSLRLRTEQMLGLPQTSLEEELDLLKMNVEIQADMAWTSMYQPYLGTHLGDYCKSGGFYSGDNDDLDGSFFSTIRLNFDSKRQKQTNLLQRIFMTCARFPKGDLLARSVLGEDRFDQDVWFKTVKEHLFNHSLYNMEIS